MSDHPRYRTYHNWSFVMLLVCAAVVILCVLGATAAFSLVRSETAALLTYATEESGHAVAAHVSYPALVALALIPAVIIGVAVWLLDRWEPEPAVLYVIAILWGAGVSALMAFFGNGLWRAFVSRWATTPGEFDFWATTVGASTVEEIVKGLGVLLIFFVFMRSFNGPMDGIVYGLLIGLGFAFTENILYLSRAAVAQSLAGTVSLQGMESWTVGAVFFQRAIVSPLVHPLATATTGMFVGFASRLRAPRRAVLPLGVVGCAGAAILHGLHNWSTFTAVGADSTYRMLFQIPVYIGAIGIIYFAAGMQRRTVFDGLTMLAEEGSITEREIPMVMNLANRTRARSWAERTAREQGRQAGEGRRAMRKLQSDLIEIAYARSINVRRERPIRRPDDEARAIARLNEYRAVFGAAL